MKTPEQIDAVFAEVVRRLPKYIRPEQVRLDPFTRDERGALRVLVAIKVPADGTSTSWSLVGEYVHGVCGWIQREHGHEWSREIGAVSRAMRAATKADQFQIRPSTADASAAARVEAFRKVERMARAEGLFDAADLMRQAGDASEARGDFLMCEVPLHLGAS